MIPELVGATFDTMYVLWLWVPGILLALLMQFRHPLDVLIIGFVISAAIAGLTYLVTYSFGLSTYSVPVTRVVLAVTVVISVFFLRRHVSMALAPLLISTAVTVSAVGLRNILRLDGWMGETDHIITLWVAEMMQAGDEGTMWTSSSAAFKKGLIFPVLLGLGRPGLLMPSIQVVIFALILVASYRLIQVTTRNQPSVLPAISFGLVLVAWVASPMFLGFPFYAHGHGIAALSGAVLARLVIDGVHRTVSGADAVAARSGPTDWAYAVTIAITALVLAQSRIEAFVLSFLIVTPLLWQPRRQDAFEDLAQRVIISLGGVMGFSMWLLATGITPIRSLGPWFLVSLLISAVVAGTVALFFVSPLRRIAHATLTISLVVALAVYLLPIGGSRNNVAPLWQNIFLGTGYWGYSWWFVLVGAVLLYLQRNSNSREQLLLWLAFVAVLFTFLAKALDESPEAWGIIRLGWSDSVNRSIFHALPLMTAVASIGFHRFLFPVPSALRLVTGGKETPHSGTISVHQKIGIG